MTKSSELRRHKTSDVLSQAKDNLLTTFVKSLDALVTVYICIGYIIELN